MDLSLPVIDGLAATRLIRKLPATRKDAHHCRLRARHFRLSDEALQAGCNSYITKPIDFNELEQLIVRELGK